MSRPPKVVPPPTPAQDVTQSPLSRRQPRMMPSAGLTLITSVVTSATNLLSGPFVSGAFTPVAASRVRDDGMTVTVTEPTVQSDGTYRNQIVAVEPGGNEYI